MNSSLMLDITQIPTQLAGLASVTTTIALALLTLLVPYTAIELNVRAMHSNRPPGYTGFLLRALIAVACLLCYAQIYSLLLNASQMMSFSILSEEDWGNFLVQNLSAPNAQSPILSWLTHPLSSIQAIILFLASLVAVTAKDVIVMLQACFLSLLFAFGPIAIVCAISEKTSSVTRGWIANSFQVALWSFVLRLVVRVWLTINPLAGNTGTGLANDFLSILTVDVVFIILVLGTPLLTARLLSGENIAAFGEAAIAGMQAIAISGAYRGGQWLNREVDRYRRDDPKYKGSWYHHPVPTAASRGATAAAATATWSYNQLFRHKSQTKPAAPEGSA